MADQTTEGSVAGPIFIHGITPRSGTNFLSGLLRAHPDCGAPSPVWEDNLLVHAEHLERYVEAVTNSWLPEWGSISELKSELWSGLGTGLVGFLAARSAPRRVVTKTPRVLQLSHFPSLFPQASLLILVRDGRSVVESSVRSFDSFRDHAIHGWAQGAKIVREFDLAEREGPLRYRIVHYENLVENLEPTLRGILSFLDLDADRYDFIKAQDHPVVGSSTMRKKSSDSIHWEGARADADFNPLERYAHWSRWNHARFNWVAADGLRALGYGPVDPGLSVVIDQAWNRLMDFRYRLALLLRPVRRAWRHWIA